MTTPDKTHRVADWPRISATVRPDGSGVLTINKTDRLCHAASVDELRTGMIARCAVIAQQLRRPVRFEVTDDTQTWQLAIRPEGYVQLIDEAGKIPPADGLTVHNGPCRVCRHIQPITAATCEQCSIAGPHRVDVQVVGPPAEHAIEQTPPTSTPALATRPTLRLFLSTAHEPIDVDSAAIGRRSPAYRRTQPRPHALPHPCTRRRRQRRPDPRHRPPQRQRRTDRHRATHDLSTRTPLRRPTRYHARARRRHMQN